MLLTARVLPCFPKATTTASLDEFKNRKLRAKSKVFLKDSRQMICSEKVMSRGIRMILYCVLVCTYYWRKITLLLLMSIFLSMLLY
jgi:hypothetical protein